MEDCAERVTGCFKMKSFFRKYQSKSMESLCKPAPAVLTVKQLESMPQAERTRPARRYSLVGTPSPTVYVDERKTTERISSTTVPADGEPNGALPTAGPLLALDTAMKPDNGTSPITGPKLTTELINSPEPRRSLPLERVQAVLGSGMVVFFPFPYRSMYQFRLTLCCILFLFIVTLTLYCTMTNSRTRSSR